MSNALKAAIFSEIRLVRKEAVKYTDAQLNAKMFHHSDSLRLTYTGLLMIGTVFESYSFEIPPVFKSKHRIGLARLEYPYYISPVRLIMFSDTDAMVVKLAGNIEHFLETNFQLDT